MADSINTSFANYDSSDFATIPESVAHAKDNPLQLFNLSDKLIYEFNGKEVIIQDSNCALKQMMFFFEDLIKVTPIPESDYYRPEITAKRLYGSADMWFILLLVNNMTTVMEFNKKNIKYIPSNDLVHLETFVRMAKNNYRTVVENDLSDIDF